MLSLRQQVTGSLTRCSVIVHSRRRYGHNCEIRLQIKNCHLPIIAQCLVLLGYPIPEMLSDHLMTNTWPDHAKFHTLWAVGPLSFVCLVTIWQAWFRLQYGDLSTWWFILLFLVFIQGSVVIAKSLYAGGPDWPMVYMGLAFPAIGLATAAGPIFFKKGPGDQKHL